MNRRVLFGVSGMHCGSCASALEARLTATEPVLSAAVNHTLGLARIEFNAAGQFDETALAQVIRSQGLRAYKASPEVWHSDLLIQQKQLEIRLGSAVFLGMWIMMLSIPFYLSVEMAASSQTALLAGLVLLTLAMLITASRSIWLMAWRNLRVGIYGSDLLITIGHLAALALSLFNISTGHYEAIYFDALAMLCLAQTVARYLEVTQARVSANSLLEQGNGDLVSVMAPRSAAGWLMVKDLRPDDDFQLSRGDVLPVDALLLAQPASFDLAVVTGETDPQYRHIGDALPAGATVLDASVELRTLAPYGEAERDIQLLQAMAEMCEKPQLQNRLDRWARRWLQALMLALGGQLLLVLVVNGDMQAGLRQLMTVLLLGCPCALSLSGVVPLYRLSLLWRKAGIRVRSLVSIESSAAVDTLVFDKTGTLTSLQLTAESVQSLQHWSGSDVGLLKVAARLSRHPASESLRCLLAADELPEPTVTQCNEYPGQGIALKLAVEGEGLLRFGSLAWLQSAGIVVPAGANGSVALALASRLIGSLSFTQIKQQAAVSLLSALKQDGYHLILCSGDTARAVQRFAAECQSLFTAVYSQQTPEQKRAVVQALKQQGHRVAMIGDGVNDVASSGAANLGIGFQHTAGVGLHQDLQLESTAQLPRLAGYLRQAKQALRISYLSVLVPVVTAGALLLLNTFLTIPPLLVAFSMLFSIVLIGLLALTIRSGRAEDDLI